MHDTSNEQDPETSYETNLPLRLANVYQHIYSICALSMLLVLSFFLRRIFVQPQTEVQPADPSAKDKSRKKEVEMLYHAPEQVPSDSPSSPIGAIYTENSEVSDASEKSDELYSLACAIHTECREAASLPILTIAIHALGREIAGRPTNDSGRAVSLVFRAKALLARFDQCGQIDDLDEAFKMASEVIEDMVSDALTQSDTTAGASSGSSQSSRDEDEIRFSLMALAEFTQAAQLSSLNTTVFLYREALSLQRLHNPKRPKTLHGLALVLVARFRHSEVIDDLNEAITVHRQALELLRAPGLGRVQSLNALSAALLERFVNIGQLQDIQDALALRLEVMERAKEARHVVDLFQFAAEHIQHFDASGQVSDLDTAISTYRRTLDFLHIDDPDMITVLHNLAASLNERAGQTGDLSGLDESVSIYRKILLLRPAPHPERAMTLRNLSSTLHTRSQQSNKMTDLDEAIELLRESLELQQLPDENRAASLTSLGSMLGERFKRVGGTDILQESVTLHREALTLLSASHPYRSKVLNNLSAILQEQYTQLAKIDNLEEAIAYAREAHQLRLVPFGTRQITLNNLANSLYQRFQVNGDLTDLNEAILLHRECLALCPPSHPTRSGLLHNLASILHGRYEQTGQLGDLDEAILLHHEALSSVSLDHPTRSTLLNNLGNVLYDRFEQTRQLVDLNEVIAFHREALDLRSEHPLRSDSLNALGNALYERFKRTNAIDDLEDAISLHRQALALRSQTFLERPASLNNLASILSARYELKEDIHDSEEAIALHREALTLREAPHRDRPISLSNLGNVLYRRFCGTRQLCYLQEAVLVHQEAIQLLPANHPRTSYYHIHLGQQLMEMHHETQQLSYLTEAIAAFRIAVTCTTSPVSDRFSAACSWAHLIDDKHESALEAYQYAIQLMRRLATLGLDVHSRQKILMSGSDGLARDAAACAIRSGEFKRAVELLEEGRSIFWTQALQLRTPLDQLRDSSNDLADKLEDLSRKLELGSYRNSSRSDHEGITKVVSLVQEAAQYRQLDDDWLATLEEVRRLDGFHDFMQPKDFSLLKECAINGPVVILNASERSCQCDALIMSHSGVIHVPLPGFTYETLQTLVQIVSTFSQGGTSHAPLPATAHEGLQSLVQKVSALLVPTRDGSEARHLKKKERRVAKDEFGVVLGILWVLLAKLVIEALELEKTDSPPRIWWCPTGLFAFLPLHAAGIYSAKDPIDNQCVFDYVISSYIPTLDTLLAAPPQSRREDDRFQMLVVIQPDTPGYPPLEHTRTELEVIERNVPQDCLVRLGVPEAPALVSEVALQISGAYIVHFACHGEQLVYNPLGSAVILADGRLEVSRIMQLPVRSTSGTRLVFLSACQSAMGSETVPDEALHIAATMLFSGFHGAVATMWSIADVDGPRIADSFYEQLFKSSGISGSRAHPDTTDAARALHFAVAKLRADCPFERWVPFVHFGL